MQEENKIILLEKILEAVPFDGWSREAMEYGSQQAGCHPGFASLVFPGGPLEIIDFYLQLLDHKMFANELQESKISERIKEVIKTRLNLLSQSKLAFAKTLSFLALPWNLPSATKFLWRTVDIIWYEAGRDISTDYNYYSKRSLLAAVYSSTLIYFLKDSTKEHKDTFDFLDRRTAEVLKLGQKINTVLNFSK